MTLRGLRWFNRKMQDIRDAGEKAERADLIITHPSSSGMATTYVSSLYGDVTWVKSTV